MGNQALAAPGIGLWSFQKPGFCGKSPSLSEVLQRKPVSGQKLFDMGNAEAHLTLVLIGLMNRDFANRMAASEMTVTPAGLTTAIGQQTVLTNLCRSEHLLFH